MKWTTALYVVRAAMSVWWCRRTVTEGNVTAVCSTVCGVQKNCCKGQCYRSVQYGVWCAEELLQRAMLPQCAVRCVVCRRTVAEGNVTAVCSTVCGVQKSAHLLVQ